MNAATTSVTFNTGVRGAWNRVADRLDRLIVHDHLALIVRVAIAAIFWLSGRTKVDGFLTVNETAFDLFRDEYKCRWCRPMSPLTWRPMPKPGTRCRAERLFAK